MEISGKDIADTILTELANDVVRLIEKGVTPTLAVILVGDNPASESYVRQKEKAAESIGAELRVTRFEERVSKEEIQKNILSFNNDPEVHGIIIQRPLPKQLQDTTLLNSIHPNKDVDGFVPGSKFEVPVALAVQKIITNIQYPISNNTNVVVIGRGETAGKPIADYFIKLGSTVSIIHSKTPDQERANILKNADIIVSCVGKKQTIKGLDIKKGVILISVGIYRDETGKLHGDYDEEEVKNLASFYTPTPGGVGPINVACLMENLVKSASK